MAFDRLQRLGKEKFQKIVNELLRGTPVIIVARLIRVEWGDCQDVREDTLAKQLKRLHTAISNGAFGGDLADVAKRKASVRIKLFHGSSLNCLDELVELFLLQRERIQVLLEREQKLNLPLSSLSDLINETSELLLSIQKMKFDLGLDEFKGVIPGMRATTTNLARPDDSETQKEVLEAIRVAEDVFRRRGIGRCN